MVVALRDGSSDPMPSLDESFRRLERFRPGDPPRHLTPLSRGPELPGEQPWDTVLALWEGEEAVTPPSADVGPPSVLLPRTISAAAP